MFQSVQIKGRWLGRWAAVLVALALLALSGSVWAVPPVVKTSDTEVMAAVRSQAGAVGYVSSTATVGEGLAVVDVVD